MPKLSFLKKDAYIPGFGFAEGYGEITEARSAFVRWQNVQNPLTVVILTVQRYDKDFAQKIDEPVEQELIVEFGPKDGSLIKVRPGNADGRDQEAEDTLNQEGGLEVGTEGNCLYGEEGGKIRGDNPFIVFMDSLYQQGFKQEILMLGFLPDLIGTRGHFMNKPGREYTAADGTVKKPESFVCDKILRYPYEQKPATPAKKTLAVAGRRTAGPNPVASTGITQATIPAPPPVNGAPTPATEAQASVELLCLQALQAAAAEHSAETVSQNKAVVFAMYKLVPLTNDKKVHKQAMDLMKDAAWFAEHAIEFGAIDAGDGNWLIG